MSSSTMKAFVMPEVGKTAVVDKPIPDPGPDDVIVKTTHALICTSDVHTVAGVLPVNPGVTLGHEALGVVYATGSNVTGFVEGQRVAVNAITPCFQCRYCQTGYTSQCGGPLGGYKYTAVNDGNLAEYFVVPHAMANLAPIPDAVSSEAAVYACDMLSTGFMGAEHCHLRIGDSVAIFAQGAVGLSATIGATLQGAGRIFAVESIPQRQALAKALGPPTLSTTAREMLWGRSSPRPAARVSTPRSKRSDSPKRGRHACASRRRAGESPTSATTARTRIPYRYRSMRSAWEWRTSQFTPDSAQAATTECSGSLRSSAPGESIPPR